MCQIAKRLSCSHGKDRNQRSILFCTQPIQINEQRKLIFHSYMLMCGTLLLMAGKYRRWALTPNGVTLSQGPALALLPILRTLLQHALQATFLKPHQPALPEALPVTRVLVTWGHLVLPLPLQSAFYWKLHFICPTSLGSFHGNHSFPLILPVLSLGLQDCQLSEN